MTRHALLTWSLGLGISLLAGVGAWRLTKPPPQPLIELPRREQPPHGVRFNAASYRYGPTLHTSSMHRNGGHFPNYAVDEAVDPPMQAKWASDSNDPEPFIEVKFREPVEVESVVVALSGSRSGDSPSNKSLEVRCLLGGKVQLAVPFHRNTAPRVTAQLQGKTCDAVGAYFTLAGDDLVRLYEIEAWSTLR